MPRQKTGGRQKGTPNKRTVELAEKLAEMGFDPVATLVAIARDPSATPELRAHCAADLLPYLYPRRKAVELSGDDGPAELIVRWAGDMPSLPPR